MAILNFKVTEDDRPGGGVYRLGTGNAFTIDPSKYPDVDVQNLSANNFFLKASFPSGGSCSKYDVEKWCNIEHAYSGGARGRINYSYSGGKGQVSVAGGGGRSGSITQYLGTYDKRSCTSNPVYEVYMCKYPISNW